MLQTKMCLQYLSLVWPQNSRQNQVKRACSSFIIVGECQFGKITCNTWRFEGVQRQLKLQETRWLVWILFCQIYFKEIPANIEQWMGRSVWSDAGQIMRVFATLIKSIARSNENPAVSSSGVVGSDFFGWPPCLLLEQFFRCMLELWSFVMALVCVCNDGIGSVLRTLQPRKLHFFKCL